MSDVKKVVTEKGSLEWVTIDGEGKENLSGKLQYVANLVVEPDSQTILAIQNFWNDHKPKGFKKDAKSLGIYAHTSATGEVDEDGKKIYEEDGKLYLAFKTGTTYADGKAKKIQIYNAKGRKVELPEGAKIGNGSVGSVSGAMGIYMNKAPGKGNTIIDAGVTLYLDAIQINELKEFTQESGFDCDDEAEGWTGEEDSFAGEAKEVKNDDSVRKPRL